MPALPLEARMYTRLARSASKEELPYLCQATGLKPDDGDDILT
jgi:hypothetical protein